MNSVRYIRVTRLLSILGLGQVMIKLKNDLHSYCYMGGARIHNFAAYTHLETLMAHQQSSELVVTFLKGDEYDGI